MKILLTGKRFGEMKRSGHEISSRLAECFPDHFDYVDQQHALPWEEYSDKYKKIFFTNHIPRLYDDKPTITRMMKIPHMMYLRTEHNSPFYNSCTNGFYYYKNDPKIKQYIPLILPPPNTQRTNTTRPCIGYYLRTTALTDSFHVFQQFLKGLKDEVDVFIMGENTFDFSVFPAVKSCTHTYDSSEFFTRITHYVYPHSEWLDPFPHSLLEAVNLNKQIIIPNSSPRQDLSDGIDDIKSVADWHTTLDLNKTYDNSGCVLSFDNFKGFYQAILEEDFEYSFERNDYESLSDWVTKEVLPLR